jgi:hypothetical protein
MSMRTAQSQLNSNMYQLTIFLFTFLGVSNLVLSVPAITHNARIMNGITAQPDQFPFAVSIQSFGSHLCGGTIISKNSIVTTAMCSMS